MKKNEHQQWQVGMTTTGKAPAGTAAAGFNGTTEQRARQTCRGTSSNIYIYIYIHVYIHIHKHTHLHIHVHAHIHI